MSANNLNLKTKNKCRIKTDLAALYVASKRNDIPWYIKFLIILIVAYALSPVDLIPDFIPILGYIDDLLILPLGIALVIRLMPDNVMEECRKEAQHVLNQKMPANWTAGLIIIAVWIVIGALVVKNIFSFSLTETSIIKSNNL